MINLPDFNKAMEYENAFWATCSNQRISKILVRYELFKKIIDIPGAIVEVGVFKGSGLIRFLAFRELFSTDFAKKVIGFDAFGAYPKANRPEERVHENLGEGYSVDQLMEILRFKGLDGNVELVRGNIVKTVPEYVRKYRQLRIALLYLDCTVYKPTLTALVYLYPKIVQGGILAINDYNENTIGVTGAVEALMEYFEDKHMIIRKSPWAFSPGYITKE